jgi:hypothetical protein
MVRSPRPYAAEEEHMLAPDTIAEVARQRLADSLREGDNERLAREARLYASAQKAAAPTSAHRSFLSGWLQHGLDHVRTTKVPTGLTK